MGTHNREYNSEEERRVMAENSYEKSGEKNNRVNTSNHGAYKSIEETYQHYTDYEFMLHRPELWIGDCSTDTTRPRWLWSPHGRIECESVTYSPALFNICDEIFANARDNRYRRPECPMTWVSVDVRRTAPGDSSMGPWVRIRNNGRGIENVIHSKYGCYVPEMLFGMLRSSSNYDDTQQRITGGRNGLGSKAANVFSHWFEIETSDYVNGTVYTQRWTNNMQHKSEPKITKLKNRNQKSPTDYTEIRFVPDVCRLGYPSSSSSSSSSFATIEKNEENGPSYSSCPSGSPLFEKHFDVFVRWMARRAIDIAGVCPGVRVTFNGKSFKFNSFAHYAALYYVPRAITTSPSAVSEQEQEEKAHKDQQQQQQQQDPVDNHQDKSEEEEEEEIHKKEANTEKQDDEIEETNSGKQSPIASAPILSENFPIETTSESTGVTKTIQNEHAENKTPEQTSMSTKRKSKGKKKLEELELVERICDMDRQWQQKHSSVLYEWYKGGHNPLSTTTSTSISWDIVVGAVPYQDISSSSSSSSSVGASHEEMVPKDIAFVNGIETMQGGTHVTLVRSQKIVPALLQALPNDIQTMLTQPKLNRCMYFFVNAVVVNPRFETQTKEKLTTPPSHFSFLTKGLSSYSSSSKESISKKTEKEHHNNTTVRVPFDPDGMKTRAKSAIKRIALEYKVKGAIHKIEENEQKQASGKKKANLKHLKKLQDAQKAGRGQQAAKCTLFVTEGDSAASFARSGIDVLGPEYYGLFPLVGKVTNVRHDRLNAKACAKIVILKSLVDILGLQFGEDYSTYEARKKLRYGYVVIMSDQDTDGSHIKALVLNFFHYFWPSLLYTQLSTSSSSLSSSLSSSVNKEHSPKIGSSFFLYQFVTPYIKASLRHRRKKTSDNQDEFWFYSQPQYHEWRQARVHDDTLRQYTIKYYKGLGTSSDEEAKEYFQDYKNHLIPFWHEGKPSDDALELAFAGTKSEDRREWLRRHVEGTYLTYDIAGLSISKFIHKELSLFSWYDNVRKIPNVLDGLKPSQRKILYGSIQDKLGTTKQSEQKVAQLSHSVAKITSYHHGEDSLGTTIVNLAQEYVGSNNVPLFVPCGQFGTRHEGGSDHSAPRYIFTYFQPHTRTLFPLKDDNLLSREYEEDSPLEPVYYVPVIPRLLCDGAHGIGTGFKTEIPSYNPLEIIQLLDEKLLAHPDVTSSYTTPCEFTSWDVKDLMPWYTGFNGPIVRMTHSSSSSSSSSSLHSSTSAVSAQHHEMKTTPEYDEKKADTTQTKRTTPATSLPSFWVRGRAEIEGDVKDEENYPPLSKDDKQQGAAMVIRITELPVGVWIKNYKKHFSDKSWAPHVVFNEEAHTKKRVHFRIGLTEKGASYLRKDIQNGPNDVYGEKSVPFLRSLQLEKTITLTQLFAFGPDRKMYEFSGIHDILNTFFPVRLALYEKRRRFMLQELENACDRLKNIIQFLDEVTSGSIQLRGQSKRSLVHVLREKKYQPRRPGNMESTGDYNGEEDEDDNNDNDHQESQNKNNSHEGSNQGLHDFDYLLQHSIWTLTKEHMEKKRNEKDKLQREYEELRDKIGAVDLWRQDLHLLQEQLQTYFRQREKDSETPKKKVSTEKKKQSGRKRARTQSNDKKGNTSNQKFSSSSSSFSSSASASDSASTDPAKIAKTT
jgi:DNA gyrase/topoisomerase IV subunit B